MSETAWATWRAAEERLARDGDLEAAAALLPDPRQAWILRATQALEAGDREALAGLAVRAPALDLESVARIATSRPGEHDPTHVRAKLKDARLPNAPLPRLDLLRLLCVAHNREDPTRPPSLAKAARGRPVLDAVLMVLSPRFTAYDVRAGLAARSPRMATFWWAGISQLRTPGIVRALIREPTGVDPLPEETWPDLEETIGPLPIGRERTPAQLASLAEFLRDPLASAWSPACEHDLDVIASRGGSPQRREALGGLLDAIDALIRGSSLEAAVEPVQAAVRLVESTRELSERQVLLQQLALLDLRLAWAGGDPGTLETVWSGARALAPAERIALALSILERSGGLALPRRLRADVLAHVVASDADWEEVVMPALVMNAEGLDLAAFRSKLGSAPRRDLALGWLHALRGSLPEALRLAKGLFAGDDEAASGAWMVAKLALRRVIDLPPRARQERRLLGRALHDLGTVAVARAVPLGADVLVDFVLASSTLQRGPVEVELVPLAHAAAQRRLDLPVEADYGDLAWRLLLASLVGSAERAQEEFRAFGHWLRRAEPAQAIPAALRLCARLCEADAVVEALAPDAEPSAEDPFASLGVGWLRATTSWLDRQDGDRVAEHALELANGKDSLARGLVTWFQDVSDLPETGAWRALLQLDQELEDGPGGELGETLRKLAAELGLDLDDFSGDDEVPW